MTARELYKLALSRNRTLRANSHAFTMGSFRRWLDRQVEGGLIEKRKGRYYLTDEGWHTAWAITPYRYEEAA